MKAAMAEGQAKEMIRNEPSITSTEVINRTTSALPILAQRFLPTDGTTRRKINRFRSKRLFFQDPCYIAELVIPVTLQNTLRGKSFL
jgi:hypothetical protein